jgi:hypothetical protein
MTAPPPAPPAPTSLSARRLGLWAALYLALAWIRLAPLSLHPRTRLADDGDALLVTWIVWWGAHHLTSGPALFDANAFFPHPGGLLYAEPQLTQAVLGWPLFRLFEPLAALNLLTIAAFAVAGLGFHLLAREWVGGDAAAFAGAVLYAFNAYTLSNVARLQIVSIGWMPLALLALHRLFVRGEARWAALFAVFSVLHGLSSFYYFVFYLAALAVLVPAYLLGLARARNGRVLARLGAAGAVAGGVVFAAVIPYLRLYRHYAFVGAERKPFDLVLYLTPPPDSPLYGGLGDLLRPPGFYLDYFVGFLALLMGGLGLAAALRERGRARLLWATWAAIGMGALLLSAGADVRWRGVRLGTGPFALLEGLGPFARMREPRRFAMLVLLCLALFVARGAAAVLARVAPARRAAAAAALAAVIGFEHASTTRTLGTEVPARPAIPDVYPWLAARPGAEPVAELPARPTRLHRFMALDQYLSTVHGKPITTGWPSFFPPALELLLWDVRDFPDARSITILRALGVRLAVVHPKRWEADRRHFERRLGEREDVLPLLARFPDRGLAVWDRYQLGAEEVRALAPLPAEGAPRACDCVEMDRARYRVAAGTGAPAALATDGSVRTRWTSGEPQREGLWLEVILDRPRTVARVEIEMAFPYGEFARNLEVTGYRGAESWPMGPLPDPWYEVQLLRRLVHDPVGARLRYDLSPAAVDRLRLAIARTDEGAGPWSVPEIHVFETAAPSGT